MSGSAFIRSLHANCCMHGAGDAQVLISDSEVYALVCVAINYLGWDFNDLNIEEIELPSEEYYDISLDWFSSLEVDGLSVEKVLEALKSCVDKDRDYSLFIVNLSALHRRRTKYKRILSTQPLPNMNQIGPRVLLEYGACDVELLANWMAWRKWIYDIDNRSAQETGYFFEPILASCLGGEPAGARNSPVKRLDHNSEPTSKGRQVDCIVPSTNTTYELKLRVTIAASGQGRFGEELSFPKECQAAGYIPVLLVLDPTPSSRLTELSQEFTRCGGTFYLGDDAWHHMEEQAGEIVSVFVDRFIKPAIKNIEEVEISALNSITLDWNDEEVLITSDDTEYKIVRS